MPLLFRILQHVWLRRCSTEFGGHMKERIHEQKQKKKESHNCQDQTMRSAIVYTYLRAFSTLLPPSLSPEAIRKALASGLLIFFSCSSGIDFFGFIGAGINPVFHFVSFLFLLLSFSLYILNGQTSSLRKSFFKAKRLHCASKTMMKPSKALLLATCPENQGVKAVISVAVMFFLATIVVAIRFYVRLVMLHGATGWDDYFILGSLVRFFFFFIFKFLCSPDRPLLEKRGGDAVV